MVLLQRARKYHEDQNQSLLLVQHDQGVRTPAVNPSPVANLNAPLASYSQRSRDDPLLRNASAFYKERKEKQSFPRSILMVGTSGIAYESLDRMHHARVLNTDVHLQTVVDSEIGNRTSFGILLSR